MENIKIGVIANTHGLKGELKVKSFSDFDEIRFKENNVLMINYQDKMIEVVIKSRKEHKGLLLITLEGMEDINQVEKYRGCEIYINKEDLHDLKEDEVYYFDLMGCQVYDDENNLIGEVEDVIETGANAVLRVNKKILIPYVKAFIKEADIENKKIVINRIEGLL